jgi:hypothetical protein
MWQSWQPAVTPVRFTAHARLDSAFTHCMEWARGAANWLVPVTSPSPVAMMAPAPTTRPITSNESTDQRALGEQRAPGSAQESGAVHIESRVCQSILRNRVTGAG